MTTSLHSKAARDALSARTSMALRAVMALSLLAACVMVLAQPHVVEPAAAAAPATAAREPAERDLKQLERVFWACDHAAATRGVDGAAGMACGSATEQWKQRRFNGDFDAMLAWWRENKVAMYQTLDRAERSAARDDLPALR